MPLSEGTVLKRCVESRTLAYLSRVTIGLVLPDGDLNFLRNISMVLNTVKLARIFRTVAILRHVVSRVPHQGELKLLCAKLDQTEDCTKQAGCMLGSMVFLQGIATTATMFRRYKIDVDENLDRDRLEMDTKIAYARLNVEQALRALENDEVAGVLRVSGLLRVVRKNLLSLSTRLTAMCREDVYQQAVLQDEQMRPK
jgi:hypothetical protein